MTFHRLIAFIAAGVMLVFATTIPNVCEAKKKKTNYLKKAVSSLQQGKYERGLKYLKRAEKRKKDSRIYYYRGYAFERLGDCERAKSEYTRARKRKGPLRDVAKLALEDLELRCGEEESENEMVFEEVVSTEPAEPMIVETQTIVTERSGLKVAGWTTMILGSVMMLSVPLKVALEKKQLALAESYFEARYGCDVTYGKLGSGCDESVLAGDEAYPQYRDNVNATKKINGLVLGIGAGFAAIGTVTVITVAAIGPKTVTVKLDPVKRGAKVAVKF